MTTDTDSPGLRFSEASGRWVVFATVAGSTVAFLTATIVNVALPAIGESLGAGVSGRQWVVTGYLLTLSALILLGGSFGDRFGRRRIYVLGLVWFTVASAACAIAPTLELLIAARVVQGIGAALLTPGSLAILQASFAPSDRARAIGAWSALISLGSLVGPPLGGVIVDLVSWRWIFVVPLPLAVAAIWAAVRHVPETRDGSVDGRLDVEGAVLSVVGLSGLTYGIIEAPNRGISDPLIVVSLVAGIAAWVAFVIVERRQAAPMLPLDIFRSAQFTAANALCFVVYAALGVVSFLLVQQLIIVLGYSATAAGLAFTPVSVLLLLLSERSGALAQRIGPRLPLTVGSALLAVGMALMAFIGEGASYWFQVLPVVLIFGLGLAGIVAPVTATALAAADDRHSGVASGVNNAVSRVAQLLAVAALPVVAGLSSTSTDLPPAEFSAGFTRAMLIAAGLAAAGAVLAATTIRNEVLTDQGGDGGGEWSQEDGREAPRRPANEWHCGVDGTPLLVARESGPSTGSTRAT